MQEMASQDANGGTELPASSIAAQYSVMDIAPFSTAFVLIIIVGSAWYHKRPQIFRDIDTCERILAASNLAQRAGPNRRISTAFGIDNTFTTTNRDYYRCFRASMEKKLSAKNTEDGRIEIATAASHAIHQYVKDDLDGDRSVSLVKLVRVTVFRIVLSLFFPEIAQPTTEDVELVTGLMDLLWYDSKFPSKIFTAKTFPSFSRIIKNRESLHIKLKEIFAALPHNGPISPRDNPLNVLLPAYMGLWRVVLYSFLEIRFRSTTPDRIAYTSLLLSFLASPHTDKWYALDTSAISAQAIIAEALRLYPPTRRLYTVNPDGRTQAVDIEALHRSGDIWGSHPRNFDPARWKRGGLDVNRTREYMPFGAKGASISRCPSRRRGGPRLCAILLGALLGEIGDGWELVQTESGDDVLAQGPLNTERGAYEGLRLHKSSCQS